ncbi:hypothetical protein [Trinickia fusca]|uniref:Lipoprotein n=1 Tax=Trinickia fusca TaxID=2419777 RepID=A0A494XNK8_9BURK|nr:hypothetical protein [Trinickia fusca]RKP52255.1 hypothetical protein D7S89_01590 [Trinickia fusca]
MKKIRLSLLASLPFVLALPTACTLYQNPTLCKQQMRSELAQASPAAKLSVSHVGVGIRGSRVVVEGSIEAPAAASSSAPASAAAGKPSKTVKAAAAECTFDGASLTALRWLSPQELAEPHSDKQDDPQDAPHDAQN